MRAEGLDRHRPESGLPRVLDARTKLISTLAFVLVVIATPIGWWPALFAEGLVLAFVVGLAGISPRDLGRRFITFFLLFGFLAVLVAPAHPARAHHGLAVVVASILIKNSLTLLAMLVLAATTPLHKVLVALRKLGVPSILVATLQFMDRYRHVLLNELDRMSTARRARTFDRRGSLGWNLLTGMVGMLFLRSFERAERVHGAMIARGWTGVIRSLDD